MIGLPSLQAMDRAQGARIWMASEATDMRRDGFLLWYKRLEVGVFKIPRVEQSARSVELRASELAMILDGIDVSKLKRVPRYQRAIESCE